MNSATHREEFYHFITVAWHCMRRRRFQSHSPKECFASQLHSDVFCVASHIWSISILLLKLSDTSSLMNFDCHSFQQFEGICLLSVKEALGSQHGRLLCWTGPSSGERAWRSWDERKVESAACKWTNNECKTCQNTFSKSWHGLWNFGNVDMSKKEPHLTINCPVLAFAKYETSYYNALVLQ